MDATVDGLVQVLARWSWDERPAWICVMPSRRRATLSAAAPSSPTTAKK